jgi:hypothetical protein
VVGPCKHSDETSGNVLGRELIKVLKEVGSF